MLVTPSQISAYILVYSTRSKLPLGWGWEAAIHPDDLNGLVEYWRSCLASGTPVDTEARMRRFDGVHRWFLFRANPLRDESGNIIKWYGTNTEISMTGSGLRRHLSIVA
jgi:PAS domain-containing protein